MTGLLIAFEGGTPDHRAALMRNVISSINMDRRILTFTDPRLPHPQSEAMCRGGLLNAFTGDCIAYRTAINPISDFLIRAAEVHHAMPLLLRSLRRGEVVFVGCFLHALRAGVDYRIPNYYTQAVTRQLPHPNIVVILQDGNDDLYAEKLIRLVSERKARYVVVKTSDFEFSHRDGGTLQPLAAATESVVRSIHTLPAADAYFRAADAMIARDVGEFECVEP